LFLELFCVQCIVFVMLCLQQRNGYSLLHFPALNCGLSPLQLVCFRDDVEKTSFDDTIVVLNHSTSNEDLVEDNPKRGILKMWTVVLLLIFTDILIFHQDSFFFFFFFFFFFSFFISILVDMSCLIVRKWLYVSKTVSTLKRRDSSFRKILGWTFEQLPVCLSYIILHKWSTVDPIMFNVNCYNRKNLVLKLNFDCTSIIEFALYPIHLLA